MMTASRSETASIASFAPFWVALLVVPISLISTYLGGFWILLVPISTWYLFAGADFALGTDARTLDPETPESALAPYTLVTRIWAPLQFVYLFAVIAWVVPSDSWSVLEKVGIFFGVGVITGTIGINYSHELMHQRNKLERWMADWLLAMVLYSHFRSEHLLVHHRYIGTPKDPVTARYNESFYRYYPRVLRQCLVSAFRAEEDLLARKNLPWFHHSNPFLRYVALQALMLAIAFLIAGWAGLIYFLIQAGVAIWQLELVNYVEHYGLTRKHLGDGQYEHVKPRHSWNTDFRASNWLLINLQRHSDHHFKPNRRFPVLQSYNADEAPQLPHGYPTMTIAAMIPPIWRRVMNPRVRAWRKQHYPEISDWMKYNKAQNPVPR